MFGEFLFPGNYLCLQIAKNLKRQKETKHRGYPKIYLCAIKSTRSVHGPVGNSCGHPRAPGTHKMTGGPEIRN